MMLRLVLRQLRLDIGRTLMRAAAIAAVLAVILLLEGVYAGQLIQLRNAVMNRGADLIVTQSGVSNLIAVRSVLPQFARLDVEAVEGVAEANPLAGIALIYEQAGERTPISLFVYDSGGGPSALVQGSPITGDREIIIDRSLATKYGLSPGDSFVLSDFEFQIAGIAEGAAAYFTPFGFVLFDDLIDFYFESELADDISTFPLLSFLLVQIDSGQDPEVVQARIEKSVPSADVYLPETLAANDMELGRVTVGPIFGMMIAISYVIGVIVTAIIMYAAISGRRQNLGILKALGFTNGYIFKFILLEAYTLLALAIPTGILLAWCVSTVIENVAPLYLIPTTGSLPLARTVLVSSLFAILGSIMPFSLVYRLDPSAVFRN
jgi:putative ABC transport system permease protein